MSRLRNIVVVVATVVIIFSAPVAGARERINVIYSSISALFLGLWVAQEAGLFERNGLDVELVYIQSSPVVLQSMMAGEAQIALAGGKAVVDSGLEGGDVIFIGGVASVPAFYFMADPSIHHISDLRGKPVGVTRFGGAPDFAMRLVLKKHQLKPITDVPIIQIAGGMSGLAAALSKRAIYAATLSTPFNMNAEKYGAKVLIDMAKSGVQFPHSTIITTRTYLKLHRSTVNSFLKAYAGGLKRMISDKPFSLNAVKKYMRVNDPALVEATYKYAMDFIERVPYPTTEGIGEILHQSDNPKARIAKPRDFIDDSLIRELDQAGAFR